MSKTEPSSGIGGQFELLIQSITDYAIFMLDREGRVISWNAGASRSMGYEADEIRPPFLLLLHCRGTWAGSS